MKRVLQISKYYYPFLGGTEQVARDMANAMLKMDNVEQKIICFNEDATDGVSTCHRGATVRDYVDGVEVIRCGYQLKISSQALSTTYSRELKRIMDEFKPNIIILHYPNPFVTHYLLKYKRKDFKLVVYWHLDITRQKILKKVFHGQNLALIERADRIIGATPKHIDESAYTPYFEGKKQIFPYMIDENRLVISEEEIEKAIEIRKQHEGEQLGFFIGRHVLYKGLKYLIEASKELGDEKIHFFIAGSGELTDELKDQANGDNKVEFLGRITDSERRSYLYACDIVCFSSITKNEGFGLALAEGMYFGKPAVTFSIPGSGVNYVNLDGVTGIECPNSDSKAYAVALKKLAGDDELREKYGKAARNRVLNNFTVERFNENMKNLIEAL
ncbi:glycosyltransferase [Sporolactobacillus sp. STCC-11]|uniref:glycosyltransferase n=1 Tax=Sporolactobacillus caesalpiniae TaxID=3230362 RepID=UPI00339985CF